MTTNSGLREQRLSLMDTLRTECSGAHAQLQALQFFPALFACKLPLESYVGQLRAMSVICATLEQALTTCSDARVASVWREDMRKLPRLQQDLDFFMPRVVPDIREAVDASLQAVEQFRPHALEQPLTLLGWLYVIEGSTLGSRELLAAYARAFLLAGDDGLSYLRAYGPATDERWAGFCMRMDALALEESERAQVSGAAKALFTHLTSVFAALHPFRAESLTCAITSINPEAGRHPVPADPREVEAAVRAGDICWQRWPYFEQRYGERGLRFARSDAVWQATLYTYPPAQILRQVRWLARVLAGRGMPTVLLEDQLEILVQELSAAVPDRTPEYRNLLAAADDLREMRRSHLSEAAARSIENTFDAAAGPSAACLPGTGALLAAAIADEWAGIDPAENGIARWLSHATRFPAPFRAAVTQALASAPAFFPQENFQP